MKKQKFKVSYDNEGDVLTIYNENKKVNESIEVTEELILDLNSKKEIVNVELLDAFKFLNTLNKKITKKVLTELKEVELNFTNYRNYWIISLSFKHHNKIITEKLPAFTQTVFESPLIANA